MRDTSCFVKPPLLRPMIDLRLEARDIPGIRRLTGSNSYLVAGLGKAGLRNSSTGRGQHPKGEDALVERVVTRPCLALLTPTGLSR